MESSIVFNYFITVCICMFINTICTYLLIKDNTDIPSTLEARVFIYSLVLGLASIPFLNAGITMLFIIGLFEVWK